MNPQNQENLQTESQQHEIPQWLATADRFRFNMPEEKEYPWLTFLLDAYALIDASVQNAIDSKIDQGKSLACKEGCTYCCSQLVPITPAEAMGIRLTFNKFLPKVERERLLPQLSEHAGNNEWKDGQCPFLVDSSCSIYTFRPIACRRYAVFNKACSSMEDIINVADDEGLNPDRAALYAALAHTSPIYESLGMTEKGKTLTFDNFKQLFVDIREIKWG